MVKAVGDKEEQYRYERKFFISELDRYEIEGIVKLHPAMFLMSYPPRYVNNLYLDSVNMKNYFDNIDGLSDRLKVRIRWYGNLFGMINKPVLELKIKEGLVGRKISIPLVSFSINEKFQYDIIRDVFRKSKIPDVLKLDLFSLNFSLLNRYNRNYYESANRHHRITIDDGMEFYKINAYSNTFLQKSVDAVNTVVELKYNPEKEQNAKKIVSHFPFRITRSSKYVRGIERLEL